MNIILCLETATTNCSVALAKENELLAVKEVNDIKYSHSENLHVFIEEILQENKVLPNQLSAVAVSKGPGSYTGLRIGVSAAKGLCFALSIPLISINTLKNLFFQIENSDGIIIPMLDARRMEVYAAAFDAQKNEIFPTTAKILQEDSFDQFLKNKKVYFLGSGVNKFKVICKHPNAVFIEGKLPSAAQMAPLAFEKLQKKDFEDVAYFEPFYLKDFMLG